MFPRGSVLLEVLSTDITKPALPSTLLLLTRKTQGSNYLNLESSVGTFFLAMTGVCWHCCTFKGRQSTWLWEVWWLSRQPHSLRRCAKQWADGSNPVQRQTGMRRAPTTPGLSFRLARPKAKPAKCYCNLGFLPPTKAGWNKGRSQLYRCQGFSSEISRPPGGCLFFSYWVCWRWFQKAGPGHWISHNMKQIWSLEWTES